MAKKEKNTESKSISFWVGCVNIALAVLWGALFYTKVLSYENVASPKYAVLFIGTIFALGFGIIFATFEKGSGKPGVHGGVFLTFLALLIQAGFLIYYIIFGSMDFPPPDNANVTPFFDRIFGS